ncbi:DUF6894 family protein [Methylobacterium sp. CM6257]
MPRYFFDVHDGSMALDEDGYECASLEEARRQAMTLLPDIARDAASRDGDRHTYTVLVTDEDHRPVYMATLSLIGLWLIR